MLKHLKCFLLGINVPGIKRLKRIKTLDWIFSGCIFRVSRSTRILLKIDNIFLQVVFLFYDKHDAIFS